MHYFIYAQKDATIYSGSYDDNVNDITTQNTGMDSILEVEKLVPRGTSDTNTISRALIYFDLAEFSNLISNGVFDNFNTNIKYYLNLYETQHQEIPIKHDIAVFPLSSSWEMGVGKKDDYPITTNGVTWNWPDRSGSINDTEAMWGSGGTVVSEFNDMNLATSQSYEYKSTDFRVDVSNTLYSWLTPAYVEGGYMEGGYLNETFENHGFVIKMNDGEESDDNYYGRFQFFSVDTNTIYPPKLEVAWDDQVWSTGDLNALSTGSDYVIYIKNIQPEYKEKSKAKIRVCGRERYPAKTFSTTSAYTTNKYLPKTTYYSVKDVHTDETLIPFGNYTKISCDSTGNFFDLWMNTLQPERYYKLLFKVEQDNGEVKYFDEDFTFKVVR